MAGEERQASQRTAGERGDGHAIHAVLFDMDGVVTRTAEAHAAAWNRLFDEYLERRAAGRGEESGRLTPISTTVNTSTASRATTACGIF